MTREGYLLDIKQTSGNQNINILFDRASIAMQAMCNRGN
jgi:hypothetical protein